MFAFHGFQPNDFTTLTGSTWRSRDALGGLLADALRQGSGRPWQSWGVRRRQEVHLAQKPHYDFSDPWSYAKLFVYSESKLAFGFYVEAPEASSERLAGHVDWRTFRDRLRDDPVMLKTLVKVMAEHHLVMTDYYKQESGGALGCRFAFQGERLQRWEPSSRLWQDTSVENLVQIVSQLPKEEWVDLHIFAQIERQKAIEMGEGVVHAILTVLRALVPIYEMTIVPEGSWRPKPAPDLPLPEELPEETPLHEGMVRQIRVNAYERNPEAHQKCIAHYGTDCGVCGIDLATRYGEVAQGCIHVHHLKQLSEIGREYEVDAIRDLRPVCPNCHAIIHRRTPPYTIEQVQAFLQEKAQQSDHMAYDRT